MDGVVDRLIQFKVPTLSSTHLWIAASAGAAGLITLWLASHRRPKNIPPGPAYVPLIGNTSLSKDKLKFLDGINALCDKYGKIFSFYIGNRLIVVVNDFSLVKEAFVLKGDTFGGRPCELRMKAYNPHYPEIAGIINGEMTSEWKRQRNNALNILRNLGWGKSTVETNIQDQCQDLISKLKEERGRPYDPHTIIGVSVSNIICKLLFGKKYSYEDPEFKILLDNIHSCLEGLVHETGMHETPIIKYFPSVRKAVKNLMSSGKRLVTYYQHMIQTGQESLASGEEPNDFVTFYLQELSKHGDSSKITQNWLLQMINDFFMAGSETTATTLLWAILYMASYADVQDKVQAEMDKTVGRGSHQFLLTDREKLPYTDATLMEIQRITAIVALGLRHETTRDATLGGFHIPKGTEVWPYLYGILNDPETWPDPQQLKPERFLGKDGTVVRPQEWVPFSMGRRTCLGEQLARQELFLFFTHILHNFRIELPEDQQKPSFKPEFSIVLKTQPYKVYFIPRF